MGRIPARPADYIVICSGRHILLDPKELKSGNRINIKQRLTQWQAMTRFCMTANSSAYFLVHHAENDNYTVIPSSAVRDAVEVGEKSMVLANFTQKSTLTAAMDRVITCRD